MVLVGVYTSAPTACVMLFLFADNTYLTPHTPREAPDRPTGTEIAVPGSSQNSQATNPYDELSCPTVQQQQNDNIEPEHAENENDIISLRPLAACGLTEEVCREFPCTGELTTCDSQRLWESI